MNLTSIHMCKSVHASYNKYSKNDHDSLKLPLDTDIKSFLYKLDLYKKDFDKLYIIKK
jgi:hypothetical protein